MASSPVELLVNQSDISYTRLENDNNDLILHNFTINSLPNTKIITKYNLFGILFLIYSIIFSLAWITTIIILINIYGIHTSYCSGSSLFTCNFHITIYPFLFECITIIINIMLKYKRMIGL